MSSEAEPARPDSWTVLMPNERRALGVLVEKAKTTPDAYPLSLNALATGCNQKSNREPVMDLSEAEIEETLDQVQKRGLAVKITGGRVERWRHVLYEAWKVEKVELAILAELLLRGPQTEGELRARASRMEPIADLDVLRSVLKPMAERGLIVYLTPEGRRGTILTHGFHSAEELERLRSGHEVRPEPARDTPVENPPGGLQELRELYSALELRVSQIADELRQLREQLGE